MNQTRHTPSENSSEHLRDMDMIRILYIGRDTKNVPLKDTFPRHQGFSLKILPQWPEKPLASDHGTPDLVCMEVKGIFQDADPGQIPHAEKIMKEIKDMFRPQSPAVFMVIPPPENLQDYLAWTQSRADKILFFPLCPEQIKKSVDIYLQRRLLDQKCQTLKHAQAKSTDLLERFYEETKALKQELIDEHTHLNQALKQVQTLTEERKRMRREFAQMKKLWYQDQKGIEEILYTLVVKQVETNRGHGERTASIADFLAEQLGMDEKKRSALGKAALLHQLGLLTMSKSLSPEYEEDMYVQYPVKGADLLSRCTCFQEAADIIRGLHENADGSGFPKGLKRQYIPILTRILTGAALFDTIRDLPEVTDTDSLLAELEKEAGTKLDPRIVGLLEKYAVLHMGAGAGEKIRGVGVEQLTPGMRLGCSIFTHSGSKLFSAGTLLDQNAITKILRYNGSYPVDDIIYVTAEGRLGMKSSRLPHNKE